MILYYGLLEYKGESALVTADLYDLKTERFIIREGHKMEFSRIRDGVYLSADFYVPWDSTTPKPHIHSVTLVFQKTNSGQIGIQNCNKNTKRCYPAEITRE